MPPPITPNGRPFSPMSGPKLPKSVPSTPEATPFVARSQAEKDRIIEIQKLLKDPEQFIINIPTAGEGVQTIMAMLHQASETIRNATGKGFNIYKPHGDDPTFFHNRYGFAVKDLKHLMDLTVGTVEADAFRLAYLGASNGIDMFNDLLGLNESRIDQVEMSTSPTGANVAEDRKRRQLAKKQADNKHKADIIQFLIDNQIKMTGMPVHADIPGSEALEANNDAIDMTSVEFDKFVLMAKKYIGTGLKPVIEYVKNVGDAAFMQDVNLLEKLGNAANFPLTSLEAARTGGPASDVPLSHVFGELGHVPGFEEAKRAHFAGRVSNEVMILNLETATSDQLIATRSTGELTQSCSDAWSRIDEHRQDTLHKHASENGTYPKETRKIIVLTPVAMKGPKGHDGKQENPKWARVYEPPKPDPKTISESIIPDFIRSTGIKSAMSGGQKKDLLNPDGTLADFGRFLTQRISKFATGFSHKNLSSFLDVTFLNSTISGKLDADVLLKNIHKQYTTSLFKSLAEAGGNQIEEQFQIFDPAETRPDGMAQPQLVQDFLKSYTTYTPISNLLSDSKATLEGLRGILAEFKISPAMLGFDEVRSPNMPSGKKIWSEMTDKDFPYIKEALLTEIQKRSNNFMYLEGPGGQGKTTSAQFLAHALGYGYMLWNPCRSKGGIVGETGKNVDAAFKFVASLREYVVCIDEVDTCLGSQEGGRDGGTHNDIVGTFKRQWTGVLMDSAKKNNLIIISTTNHGDRIPIAEKRRLSMHGAIELGYKTDKTEIQDLVNVIIDRSRNDPSSWKFQALKQPYADALFREACPPKKAPYSNDEVGRVFDRWVAMNRQSIIPKYGEQFAYKPETLVWLVQNSGRQSRGGTLETPSIPDNVITGQHPKETAPPQIKAPGYEPLNTETGTPNQRPATPGHEQPGEAPNVPQARLDAEDTLLPLAKSVMTKKIAEKSKIKLMSIAETPLQHQLGLKHIKSLPDMTGMLFKFQSPKVLSFWMADTYLPLDIAFIDKDGIVAKTASLVPMSTRSVNSETPCVMALEVEAGTLERVGGVVGKKLVLDGRNKTVYFE